MSLDDNFFDDGAWAPPEIEEESAPTASAPEEAREPWAVRCLAGVQSRPVDWLARGRIPFGMITILDGDPGLGKTTLTIDLAARVSTGRALFDDGPEVEPA